jgi:hypothetical protein
MKHASRFRSFVGIAGAVTLLCAVAPPSFADVDSDVFASATRRDTGAQVVETQFTPFPGTNAIQANAVGPGSSLFGPSAAEAYSNSGGTFWVQATAGTLEPYATEAVVLWTSTQAKTSATQWATAKIAGATMQVIDYGSQFDEELLAEVSFSVALDGVEYAYFVRQIVGRGGPAGSDFDYVDIGSISSLPEVYVAFPDDSFSDRVSSAQYQLQPFVLDIDLGSVAVGQSYELTYLAYAKANNIGGETQASAYFRDPLSQGGGIAVSIVDVPLPPVPEPATNWLLGAGVLGLTLLRRRAGLTAAMEKLPLPRPQSRQMACQGEACRHRRLWPGLPSTVKPGSGP